MVDSIDLKALRTRLGWSQVKMAAALGLDRASVSRMEAGVSGIKGPTRKLLEQLVADEKATREAADSAPIADETPKVKAAATGDAA